MRDFSVKTHSKNELIDITTEVQAVVADEKAVSGICVVHVPHTTAGLTINENADPSVQRDILAGLRRLVPENGDYTHAEGNSDAHIKATLVGSSVTVPIEDGRLQLGTWQGIFFCEFDGPRQRRVWIQIR